MNIPSAPSSFDSVVRGLQMAAAQLTKLAVAARPGATTNKLVVGGVNGSEYGKDFMLERAAEYIRTFKECPKKGPGGNWHPVTALCAETLGGLPCPRAYTHNFGTLKEAWREAIALHGVTPPVSAPYGAARPGREGLLQWIRDYYDTFGELPQTKRGKHVWTEATADNAAELGTLPKYNWYREAFGTWGLAQREAGFDVIARKDSRRVVPPKTKAEKTFKAPAGSFAEIPATGLKNIHSLAGAVIPEAQVLAVAPVRLRGAVNLNPEPVDSVIVAALRYYDAYGCFPVRGRGNHWSDKCRDRIDAIGGFPSPGVVVRRYQKLANAWARALKLRDTALIS